MVIILSVGWIFQVCDAEKLEQFEHLQQRINANFYNYYLIHLIMNYLYRQKLELISGHRKVNVRQCLIA